MKIKKKAQAGVSQLCMGLICILLQIEINMMNSVKPFYLINTVAINVGKPFWIYICVCVLTKCALKPWKLDGCTLVLSAHYFCLWSALLLSAIFTCTALFSFYTVTTHFTTSGRHLSPVLPSTNIALCVSCTAPDKQHEKQHSHQSQRQQPLCCTGTQLCVRPSVRYTFKMQVFVYERERGES